MMRHLVVRLAIAALVIACSSLPSQPPGPGVSAGPGVTAGPGATFGPGATLSSGATIDPNAAFDPAALADAVVNAGSDGDREHAVLAALASIGLGVYSAEGEPIVSGAERTSTDFMVYDFEVIALSGGIEDGDEVFLDDVAAELSVMNVSAGGTAFTPEVFATAVTTATAGAMADPGNTAGYALRLARELSMRRAVPVDLAAAPGAEPIILDPLSSFLVAADVSLPKILGADPAPVANASLVGGVRLASTQTAADPCARFRRQVGSNWYAGMTNLPGSSASNASFSRSLQAQLLGGTVKFASTYDHSWHHRHPDERGYKGYKVALQVRVQVPPRINCGPIRFVNNQPVGGGAIVGAEVTWTHPDLEHHGTIDCTALCVRTDASGFAFMAVEPFEEPKPGGIGPEFKATIPVTAEVNLFKALGPDLLSVLSLPPNMRVLARKEMPTDVSWHRAFKIHVSIDSELYINKARAFEYANHVGTATVSGVLEADTLHRPGDLAYLPPKIGTLVTVSDKGRGPFCATGVGGSLGSIIIEQNSGTIDFQVIDAVIYPPNDISLYLDVGPADDYRDDTYRHRACDPRTGQVVLNTTSPGTNLWEATIFAGYPRGLSFKGSMDAYVTTQPDIWNRKATPQDWEGDSDFVVAVWETPQKCGGYCDPAKSWLNMTIIATPLADP